MANRGARLMLFLTFAGFSAAAQAQSTPAAQSASSVSSLGDYARQVRKDPANPSAKPKVFDNDNLPREDKLSIVGAAPATSDSAPAESPSQPAGDDKSAAATKPASDDKAADPNAGKPLSDDAKQAMWKEWGDKLKSQQDQIDLDARELDVLQREYKTRAAAMYGDVGNRLRNSADWDKQDAQYKQQIADKQKALDDAKQKLDDMQEEARKAGVPSSIRDAQPQTQAQSQ
jgi:hypothetical protein